MSKFKTFKQLHQQADPLLLGNIWDVNSAKLFEAAGYKAIGVSSHAIANAGVMKMVKNYHLIFYCR